MKVLIVSVIVALVASLSVALAVDVKLEYQRYPDENRRGYLPHGYAHVEAQTERPPGDWVLPELRKPLYGLVQFADGPRLFIFDMADESSEFFDRVYFDDNANRDLTDETVIQGGATVNDHGGNRYARVNFPATDTTVTIDGTALPFSFRVGASGHNLTGFDIATATKDGLRQHCNFSLQLNCSYSGIWTNAVGTHRLTLADRNCNGSFTDAFKLTEHMRYSKDVKQFYSQGDALYVSEGDKIGYYDSEALPHWLLMRDELYTVTVDQVAGRLTLSPVDEPTAQMRLPVAPTRLVVHTKGDSRSVVAIAPGKSVKLLPGDYRLLSYQVTKKTDEGDEWMMQCAGTSLGAYVGVAVDGEAQMELGEPYTPVASVPHGFRRQMQGRDSVRLQFSVSGAGGESVSHLARLSGAGTAIAMSTRYGTRPKEPSYKILSKDGEVITQGNFEYG